MFSNNKKDYRTLIFSAVIIALCALIAVLLWPEPPVENIDNSSLSEPAVNQEKPEEPDMNEVTDPAEEPDENEVNEEDNMSGTASTYYLVKRAGSEIVVFFCHPEREPVRLETTNILYELLGAEDQKLFDEGVMVDNQEQLSVLLQDFES